MTATLETGRGTSFSDLPPEAELALLARVLDAIGFVEHNVGHLTYRQPDDTLLTLPWELGWDEVRASDVMKMDLDGNVLAGQWTVTPAITLHLELHRARPGTRVAIHNHPKYATIWAARHQLPPIYDQTSATCLTDQLVLYNDYKGAVIDSLNAKEAVEALGTASCALLANHGVFVVADSVPQAHQRCLSLEWRSQQAWMVEAAGGGVPMPDEGVRAMEELAISHGEVFEHQWEWAVRRELRRDRSVLE
jgi:L-fuculose-phosphate aldolase